MEWIRYHPKTAAVGAALVTVLVIVLVTMMVSKPSPEEPAFSSPLPTATPTAPLSELPTVTPSAKPAKKPTGSAEKQFAQALAGLQGKGGGGAATGGTLQMQGLQGGSMYKYLPKHHIVLRATSQAPLGTIGYIMPTSLNESSGIVKNYQGHSWSISSTVYGNPDYAQIYLQAGSRGYPITCTITVDGKVTEQRSTEGPYGQMVCQG
ncbi:MAG: hypothetical protein J7518_13785 [Nocardioidaceae bacterium]|nr:hypothetical protein [Nocardioidaceae bacterium]